MKVRRPLLGLALAMWWIAISCAGEPAEVAERGAAELGRHQSGEWVRVRHPALEETAYEAVGAHVDPGEPGVVLDFTTEHRTRFSQEMRSAPVPALDVFPDLRDDLTGRGAEALGVTCQVDDRTRSTWHFAVASQGDWLAIDLIERPDGLVYEVIVRDRRGHHFDDRQCP